MSLDDKWNCELGYEGLNERPGRCANAGGVSGIAAECGGYDIGPGALCGESIVDGSDIRTDGPTEFGMKAADDLGPRLGFGQATVSAVESNDIGTRTANGEGRLEVWSNVDIAVRVDGLGDADDGKIGLGPEGGDPRNALGAKSACSSAKDRGCQTSKGIEVIEWVSGRCLAGDDKPAAKGRDYGVSGVGLGYRHDRVFFASRDEFCCPV